MHYAFIADVNVHEHEITVVITISQESEENVGPGSNRREKWEKTNEKRRIWDKSSIQD